MVGKGAIRFTYTITVYCLCFVFRYYFCLLLNTEETTFQTKKMNLSLSVDAKINLTLWTTKPDHCVESFRIRSFFLVPIFPAFGLNMETYRVSHWVCDIIWVRPTPNANIFHAVDVRTLLRYFNTILFSIYRYKLAE